MEMFRRTYADINLENLIFNWNQIKKIAADDRFICPMIKANAYGHGDVQIGKTLEKEGANVLGVCLIEEGLLLRASGIKTDILVFRGFDKRGAEKIMEYQLTPVVSSWQQIQHLEAVADEPMKIHLKFNTGMSRLGFAPSEAEKLRQYFSNSKKLKLKAVLTHFTSGEDAASALGQSARQTQVFSQVFDYFKDMDVYAHLLNTGGIVGLAQLQSGPQIENPNKLLLQQKWGFRPGLMLYGYTGNELQGPAEFRAVMSLKSVVNNMRRLEVGDSVSYGSTWVAQRPSYIAVVPIGYADGIHRLVSNRGYALLNGERVPIVGRVCMDFLMLDATDVVEKTTPEQWVEEEVILFGYDDKNNFLSATEQALHTNTIVWETLTSVGERVPRHFRGLKKT
ncbi:alanine racemase [Pseudobdellovibrio exovorus]|uniref:Alanine racemase n=1 Tax=Pseudobdellovibrio exovorus JSS TaxID=1184267 RepID=M4VDS5_9BACT|nr:alanine racemase [Pseudobdellovibrio exovorus]AGH96191.1 hypothetical protein A11Q_1975 [Pseudobdellovibrio exovorus JSS]